MNQEVDSKSKIEEDIKFIDIVKSLINNLCNDENKYNVKKIHFL